MPSRRTPIRLALAGSVLGALPAPAHADGLAPSRPNVSEGLTDDDGGPSVNVSGIACRPPIAGRRICVVIDDEGKKAQIAEWRDGRLRGGAMIKLIGKHRAVRGTPPQGKFCGKDKGFDDLDGEGVAYAAPYFYVVGSHGCGRNSDKFAVSSFITIRFRLDDDGRLLGPDAKPLLPGADEADGIEATYRLADALRSAAPVGAFFGKTLQGPDPAIDGLNVEGVVVVSGVLFAGLRAPSIDGRAFLVGASVAHLFAPGPTPLAVLPDLVTLDLGPGTGIRDLSVLPDGRLLGLSGPVRDNPATQFDVFVAPSPLSSHVKVQPLARLTEFFVNEDEGKRKEDGKRKEESKRKRAKAEAILPLDVTDGTLSAVILFDGLPNGGGGEYRMALPAK